MAREVRVGLITFAYSESSWSEKGAEKRGIAIWRRGFTGDEHVYEMIPGPPDTDEPDADRLSAFYLQWAAEIGRLFHAGGGWPERGKAYVGGDVRTFFQRRPCTGQRVGELLKGDELHGP